MVLGSLGISVGYTNTVYTSIRQLSSWDSGAASSVAGPRTNFGADALHSQSAAPPAAYSLAPLPDLVQGISVAQPSAHISALSCMQLRNALGTPHSPVQLLLLHSHNP